MKYIFSILFCLILCSFTKGINETPAYLKHVDQLIWVVKDLNNTIDHWKALGFEQIMDIGVLDAKLKSSGNTIKVRMAIANLGGANITWIQPTEELSVFSEFHKFYGDGAMSLVHRFDNKEKLQAEVKRLAGIGVRVKEEITIFTKTGKLHYILMDTYKEGKYYLGLTYGGDDLEIRQDLASENLHNMKINQYAFAVLDYKNISKYWEKIGLPEFQINHPELGNPKYYGEPVNHDLIQGWQKHGTIAYEWCIPVKGPIVYEDHIKKHGEGIHHLAFTVKDMDEVLADYRSKGYVVSMGGTWGKDGKPGSGRYEYIDLENAGGLTLELLWNYP